MKGTENGSLSLHGGNGAICQDVSHQFSPPPPPPHLSSSAFFHLISLEGRYYQSQKVPNRQKPFASKRFPPSSSPCFPLSLSLSLSNLGLSFFNVCSPNSLNTKRPQKWRAMSLLCSLQKGVYDRFSYFYFLHKRH
jgi:hypothetical protein